MLTREQEIAKVDAAIAKFPETFRLKSSPGKLFRISRAASYCTMGGDVMLYLSVQTEHGWCDYCKGTPEELRAVLES